jgi:hypothetical protein
MKTILKLLIPLLLISAVAGTPLSSAMLKYDKCPIPENVENPKDLSNYINTLSYDYDKAELVHMGVNTAIQMKNILKALDLKLLTR